MAAYFRAVATPVEKPDCMRALLNAWIKQQGSRPKDDAIRLMAAQWGVETGWGTKGYCYNLGNIRTTKFDYTYIDGNELIDGKLVWFKGTDANDMARFRAFRTLESAAEVYVTHLTTKKPVLEVLTGSCEPTEFTKALKTIHYFTAPLDHYTKGYLSCFHVMKAIPVPAPGPIEGYATLEPDPEGDPALRSKPDPVEPARPDSGAGGGVAPERPSEGAVLVRRLLAARRVGASDPPPRLRIGGAPPPTPQVSSDPDPRPPAQARRGAQEIFESLPPIVRFDTPEVREATIWAEIEKGNFPSFAGTFVPVVLTDGQGRRATFQVTVDCFAVGTEDDWLRVALSGYYAQKVASYLGGFLPTNRIVLETYNQAKIKLVAHLFDCQSGGAKGRWQRSTYALHLHEEVLQGRVPCQAGHEIPDAKGRLDPKLGGHPGKCALPSGRHPGVLVSGHLKEVIISHEDLTKRLAFWGFFTAEGRPIQRGFGIAHGPGFADYSHGFRIVGPIVDVDGRKVSYEEIVTSDAYASLVFAEGGRPCRPPRYPAPPKSFYMGR